MVLAAFPGSGADIEEPDWGLLIPDQITEIHGINGIWRDSAHREWLRIVSALRDVGTLAPENRHQIQRLVVAYIRYDRAASRAFELGVVMEAPRTGTPMVNLWQVEMRQADSDATTAEMELGITPRRRAAVAKAKRSEKLSRAADKYIGKSASA